MNKYNNDSASYNYKDHLSLSLAAYPLKCPMLYTEVRTDPFPSWAIRARACARWLRTSGRESRDASVRYSERSESKLTGILRQFCVQYDDIFPGNSTRGGSGVERRCSESPLTSPTPCARTRPSCGHTLISGKTPGCAYRQ